MVLEARGYFVWRAWDGVWRNPSEKGQRLRGSWAREGIHQGRRRDLYFGGFKRAVDCYFKHGFLMYLAIQLCSKVFPLDRKQQ